MRSLDKDEAVPMYDGGLGAESRVKRSRAVGMRWLVTTGSKRRAEGSCNGALGCDI